MTKQEVDSSWIVRLRVRSLGRRDGLIEKKWSHNKSLFYKHTFEELPNFGSFFLVFHGLV